MSELLPYPAHETPRVDHRDVAVALYDDYGRDIAPDPVAENWGTDEAPGSAREFWDYLGSGYDVNDPEAVAGDEYDGGRVALIRKLVFAGPRDLTDREVSILGFDTRFDIDDAGRPINPFCRYVKTVTGRELDPATGAMTGTELGPGGEGVVGIFGLRQDQLTQVMEEKYPGIVDQYREWFNR